MSQAIDPIRLKAAAEHLEWVLQQYPEDEEARGLLHALRPLIDAAVSGDVSSPMDRRDIPGAYNFANGAYTAFKDPNLEDAYVAFSIELRGGLTEQEQNILARIGRLSFSDQALAAQSAKD